MTKKQYPPTPILVLYFDVSEILHCDYEVIFEQQIDVLEHYKQFGWEILFIPVKNASTKLEVAAIDGSFDPIQFEQFKKEILEKCKK